MNNISQSYIELKQYDQAIATTQQGLSVAQILQDQDLIKRHLLTLGLLSQQQHYWEQASTYYQRYLQQPQITQEQRISILELLMATYQSQGNDQAVLKAQTQLKQLGLQSKNRSVNARTYFNLGQSYQDLGNNPLAIQNFKHAAKIYRELKDTQKELRALNQLGKIYIQLSDYQRASDIQKRAFSIMGELSGTPEADEMLSQISIVQERFNRPGFALVLHQINLLNRRNQGDRQGEALALSQLGRFHLSLGILDKALNYYQQSLNLLQKLEDPQGIATILNAIGSIYSSQNQLTQGLPYIEQALEIHKQQADPTGIAIALNNLGWTHEQLGDLPKAEKILKKTISLHRQNRQDNLNEHQVSLFEEQARTYRILQRVLVAQGKSDEALVIAEQSRAQAFANLLNRQHQIQKSAPTKPLSLKQIQQTAQEQQATIVHYSLIQDSFRQDNLNPTTESELYIWVISPEGEIQFETVDLRALQEKYQTSLATLLASSRDAIAGRGNTTRAKVALTPRKSDTSRQTQNLKQLHQLLIEPIASYLPTDETQPVILIPHEALLLTPFPALLDHNNAPLIQHHTLLSAPSVQILRETHAITRSRPTSEAPPLIVGNPKMPKVFSADWQSLESLLPLPGAAIEANTIAKLLQTQAFSGAEATEKNIIAKMPTASLIHLATHGIIDEQRGLNSAIALAPEPGQPEVNARGQLNGMLTAEEILGLNLSAEMAVLSACDTGSGRITGDGVIGLSRAFIAAGVPNVLVSLWAVPDAPTADLMMEFYHNLQKKKLNKAQALRQAMLTTMKYHPDPKDWAAFTLIGHPN